MGTVFTRVHTDVRSKASDLQHKLLDYAAGPSSFNAQLHELGLTAVSCDPIYQFSANQMAQQIDKTHEAILNTVRKTQDNFVWRQIRSPEHLGELRQRAMKEFLEDFPAGVLEGRYRTAELPNLPFHDGEFDLSLCSHFLFTYSNKRGPAPKRNSVSASGFRTGPTRPQKDLFAELEDVCR